MIVGAVVFTVVVVFGDVAGGVVVTRAVVPGRGEAEVGVRGCVVVVAGVAVVKVGDCVAAGLQPARIVINARITAVVANVLYIMLIITVSRDISHV